LKGEETAHVGSEKRIMPLNIDLYICKECKERYVVPSLARCCEMKHEGVVFVRSELEQIAEYEIKHAS
jgi:uncharacterized protein YlaI